MTFLHRVPMLILGHGSVGGKRLFATLSVNTSCSGCLCVRCVDKRQLALLHASVTSIVADSVAECNINGLEVSSEL